MTINSLSDFYDSTLVRDIILDVDMAKLAFELNETVDIDFDASISTLRVASFSAVSDIIGEYSLDTWLRRQGRGENLLNEDAVKNNFIQWNAYLSSFEEDDSSPELDDVLTFAFSGFIAKRPNEVRDLLRRETPRRWIDNFQESLRECNWPQKVRGFISLAILLIIRQEYRADIIRAGEVIQELSALQKRVEAEWLSEQSSQQRIAIILLGLYHVAQAVLRTSEFLLVGSVENEGRVVSDFGAELERLLIKAEEFLETSADPEILLWLKIAGITLFELRESSIWVQGKGISERIDRLIEGLTREGRNQPIFSLLPSQCDALRQALLDRSRLAIVLQMPTSAGKTLLAELSIVQTFDAYRETNTKVVYVVPTRALATQIRRTLAEDLVPLGINVSAAGSAFEEDPYELQLLQDADGVVVSTPEKLDLMLRSHPQWFSDLRLIVVDEAHLLSDGDRGVRLELLLANIRREVPESRLLLLTPFMDNANQIAAWLSRSRGHSISVSWRPAKIILGMAQIAGRGANRKLTVTWKDPLGVDPKPLKLPTSVPSKDVQTNTKKILFLAEKFNRLGTSLAMFSASPADAEKAAAEYAQQRRPVSAREMSPQQKVSIALAKHEYGDDSQLAFCLERGVSFHHSSISPILRYLIENQVRSKQINFIAATSTLAQGMNFPVATVLVHSVHKPYGQGHFSSGEFWNIAGRAGRVGMVEKGLVIFADNKHQEHLDNYSESLSQSLQSALLAILNELSPEASLKEQYRKYPQLRPFIQYLAHAAAYSSPESAIANLEELLQQSLANQQVQSRQEARKLRSIARAYLENLLEDTRGRGLLRVADSAGLGSFSFKELYAKLLNDEVLNAGPREIMNRQAEGIYSLINALQFLPELNLALGKGEGEMDIESVANLVQGWLEGKQVHELAEAFPGINPESKLRKTARYVYSTVSQTISWGTHAYLKGWAISSNSGGIESSDAMLPAYVQYGVRTPEAAVASLLGIPRPFAEAFGQEYRFNNGDLQPSEAGEFKSFIESADETRWASVIERSEVPSISTGDMRKVVREMQGIES